MSEETKTEFINKPTNRGFERIEFRDHYGVDCSIQASSLATEECIWFGCSKLELKGFRPGSGWLDIDADSLGFKYLQGNTRMHLTREQVQNLLPILEDFAYANLTEQDVVEVTEVLQNAVREGNELAALRDQSPWIAVSERLPENVGWYLVTIEELSDLGRSKFTFIVSYGHSSERGFYWRTQPGETVIAWQNRPSPYVTEGQDGTKS